MSEKSRVAGWDRPIGLGQPVDVEPLKPNPPVPGLKLVIVWAEAADPARRDEALKVVRAALDQAERDLGGQGLRCYGRNRGGPDTRLTVAPFLHDGAAERMARLLARLAEFEQPEFFTLPASEARIALVP